MVKRPRKEHSSWLERHRHSLALLAIFVLAIASFWFLDFTPPTDHMVYGTTFSVEQATKAGLYWRQVYTAMLDDLRVDHVRLIASWDQTEPSQGKFNYRDLDWQIDEAARREVKVILSIGQRVPRWPECFIPDWAKQLDQANYQKELIDYVTRTVSRYQRFSNIMNWQIENEPFLDSFGFCPKGDLGLLQKEITAVKMLDARPIITTDSGELGLWYKAARAGDIFGTTMYRKVWNKYIGFFTWLLPPSAYTLKTRLLAAGKPVYVLELQAEPWGSNFRFITEVPLPEQLAEFNQKHLLANVDYAKKAGFNNIYLWGVEWWYWLKQNDQPELWETAKKFWAKS